MDLVLFALLFVALAFAMFGAFTLQLPSALQTRLTNVSNQQKSGTYIGTFIMGALSALVVTACVAPALIAALSVISQTGQIARGAGALYATGLGMGVPLLLVGASAGSLLPKVGPWMDTVKSLFGVMFLGVAVYFVQPLAARRQSRCCCGRRWRWSPASGFSRSRRAMAGRRRRQSARPACSRSCTASSCSSASPRAATDPLQPLSALRAEHRWCAGFGAARKEPGLAFETIKSVEDLQANVAAASAAGKPVMLDFYADWCVSCKEMEKYTFTDASVQSALSNAVLLRADVTANDEVDQALLQHFGIFGPPTIAFYDPAGQERRNFRVVGYMKAPNSRRCCARRSDPQRRIVGDLIETAVSTGCEQRVVVGLARRGSGGAGGYRAAENVRDRARQLTVSTRRQPRRPRRRHAPLPMLPPKAMTPRTPPRRRSPRRCRTSRCADRDGVSRSLRTGRAAGHHQFLGHLVRPLPRRDPAAEGAARTSARRIGSKSSASPSMQREPCSSTPRTIGIDYPILIGEKEGYAAAEAFGVALVLPVLRVRGQPGPHRHPENRRAARRRGGLHPGPGAGCGLPAPRPDRCTTADRG